MTLPLKKTGRGRFPLPRPARNIKLLRKRQLICAAPMSSAKQLPRTRIDRQTGNGHDRQTRRRHRPSVGRVRAGEFNYAEVGRRIKYAHNRSERTAVDRLVTNWRAEPSKVT